MKALAMEHQAGRGIKTIEGSDEFKPHNMS
jgi:hypothetical protein